MENKYATRQTVLVIDDDRNMLHLMQRILENSYDVSVAADGIAGLALFREKNPNLVILDIMMPGPDGLMVLDSIRKSSNVPVIMVSAKPEFSTIEATASLGADDYIEKPFHPATLLARVKSKLRRADWNHSPA